MISFLPKKNSSLRYTKGFAMLFTVLVVSLILSIALSISSLTYKQGILSNLAKDSQISYYEADSAIECGLLYDLGSATTTNFARGSTTVIPTITCGNKTLTRSSLSSTDYLIYEDQATATNQPCFAVLFDKTDLTLNGTVEGYGYNLCDSSPRQVERALKVQY